jgi:hypothetical protein
MAKNEFLQARSLKGTIVIPSASATSSVSAGVVIPAGAIITNVRRMAAGAVTLTGASATFQLRVGTFPIASTVVGSLLGAQTVPTTFTLLTAGGVYVPATGELNILAQASSNSALTATYDVYVDYIYA